MLYEISPGSGGSCPPHGMRPDLSPQPKPQAGVVESKIAFIRARVLETIRSHMPITTLFTPELKMDFGVFIKDQVIFRQLAEFLSPFAGMGPISQTSIAQRLEGCDCLKDIRSFFKRDSDLYLHFFYDACIEALTHQMPPSRINEALLGRIFTIRNALIAQADPHLIRKRQGQYGVSQQEALKIQEEGAIFIRESLGFHLDALTKKEGSSFQEQLISTTGQLVPFVRKITKLFIEENQDSCPDDPLTFRNPTGYNRHGLVAATAMGACLHALGYKTRIMSRTDLEPTVTLATAHSIVEVTSLEKLRYIVDPTHIQFYKDVCLDESSFPASPVLVLQEGEVESYIERTLMVEWKKSYQGYCRRDRSAIQKLNAHDQLLLFELGRVALPKERNFLDSESWVRKALQRVWGLSTYCPVYANTGFQQLFNGSGKTQSTYDYISPLGIAPLTQYLSTAQVESRLEDLLKTREPQEKNSSLAVSLILQLPTLQRDRYASLLDLDTRIDREIGLGLSLNAYFRSLKRVVNPGGREASVVYGCSGADCMSVLLATDASDIMFIDLTKVSFRDFQEAFRSVRDSSFLSKLLVLTQLEKTQGFFQTRSSYGGSTSVFDSGGGQYMEDLAMKLFFDLQTMGVDFDTVSVKEEEEGVSIEFSWQYQGAALSRHRRILFVRADISKPDSYPALLKRRLSEGIDIFYMKAPFFVPLYYPEFLPLIAKSIRVGGWLMTADKTMTMDPINPETCLQKHGLSFARKRSDEVKMFEECMRTPLDPFCTIAQLEVNRPKNRHQRAPGSDHTYWAILNLRQKIS